MYPIENVKNKALFPNYQSDILSNLFGRNGLDSLKELENISLEDISSEFDLSDLKHLAFYEHEHKTYVVLQIKNQNVSDFLVYFENLFGYDSLAFLNELNKLVTTFKINLEIVIVNNKLSSITLDAHAPVGHFGIPVVSAILEYIQNKGIPMVYAASSINALYFDNSPGNSIFAVQPFYLTDGRLMTARILNESLFGSNGNQKIAENNTIGVLHTNSEYGLSITEGIKKEIAWAKTHDGFAGSVIYKVFNENDFVVLSSAINEFIAADVSAVIVASNQSPFKAAISVLQQYNLKAPVFTSYTNADTQLFDP